MTIRIQFTIPEAEAQTICKDICAIACNSAIVATTNAPMRTDSKLVIVLTDDTEIEFMLKLKYAGCEVYTIRF